MIIHFRLLCFFSGVEGSNGWCPGGTDTLSAGAVAHQQGKWCQGAGCPPWCCALPAGAAARCFPLPETPLPFPPTWSTRRGAANQPQWLCPRRGLCAVSISKDYLNSSSLCHINDWVTSYVHFHDWKSKIAFLLLSRKSTFDMFNFLASQHRQLPESRPCDDEEDDVMLKSSRLDAQQHVNKICEQYHVNIIHLHSKVWGR